MLNTKSNAVAKTMATFDDAKRILARLMARENISVQYVPGLKTADFNTVTRILRIPQWQNLSVDQFDLLVAHEVGHALYTNTDYIKSIRANRGLMSYFNVVEDARIERKMKQSFPGLKKIFTHGYAEFHQNGPLFKGTRTHIENPSTGQRHAIKSMSLIDRINLHYKLTDATVDVPFSASERSWLDKIDAATSMDEVLEIAKALHKLAKEQNQDQPQPPQPPQDKQDNSEPSDDSQDSSDDSQDNEDDTSDESDESDASDEDDDEDSDSSASDTDEDSDDDSEESDASDSTSDSDESDETEDSDDDSSESDASDESDDSTESDNETESDDDAESADNDPEAETDKHFTDAMNELGENAQTDQTNVRHVLLSPLTDAILREHVMPASEWATTMDFHQLTGIYGGRLSPMDVAEKAWNDAFMSTAKLMAMEFERRKSARAYEHAKTAKTGRIDMAKLHAYKFADDIFKRSMTVPAGKSHGIVMLIDGSDSMQKVFPSVIDQVLLFANFAKMVKIPFEAYMFTNHLPKVKTGNVDMGEMTLTIANNCSIIGLVSTTDTNFKLQMRALIAVKNGYDNPHVSIDRLTGTPLHSGILLAERMVARMKQNHKLDKMTFICVSDGDDNSMMQYRDRGVDLSDGSVKDKMTTTGNSYYGNSNPLVMRDTVTKRNLVAAKMTTDYSGQTRVTSAATLVTAALMDSIHDRHLCRTIYLYLVDSSAAHSAADYANGYLRRDDDNFKTVKKTVAFREMTATRQFTVPAECGPIADCAMLVPVTALQMRKANFANVSVGTQNAKQVTAAFVQEMKATKANRVFVNTVIPYLA